MLTLGSCFSTQTLKFFPTFRFFFSFAFGRTAKTNFTSVLSFVTRNYMSKIGLISLEKFVLNVFFKLLFANCAAHDMYFRLKNSGGGVKQAYTFTDILQMWWDPAFAVKLLYFQECSYLNYHSACGHQTWQGGGLP